MEEVLIKRAALLAKVPEDESLEESQMCVLEFTLGDEIYGIDIQNIKEALPVKEITPLPGAPPHVLGVMNIRRTIVPVFNLKQALHLHDTQENALLAIVLEKNNMILSFLIDKIIGTKMISRHSIEPPPSTFSGLSKEILLGLTREKVILLKSELFFSDKTFIISKEI